MKKQEKEIVLLITKQIELLSNENSLNYWGSEENIEMENKIFNYFFDKKLINWEWLDKRLKQTNIETFYDLIELL